MQTRKHSFVESLSNTAVGFVISLASLYVVFPFFGIETSHGTNVLITLYFTVISITRSYIIRRFFNKKKRLNKYIQNIQNPNIKL